MGKKSFISIVDNYFNRFSSRNKILEDSVSENLSIIVVIPSFNEKDVVGSVESLLSCVVSNFSVEIIIVVNHSENANKEVMDLSLKNIIDLNNLSKKHILKNISVFPIYISDLKDKHAGVGWARKIGMDEGLRRFKELNKDGVLVGFDADSKVKSNYFSEIHDFFSQKSNLGASIYFEHPIKDKNFSEAQLFNISCYELHLRYYKNVLKYCGFPYAYHTVGSSFAVRASAYAKQGGMNRRKAGEDFYFINKVIKGGGYGEINNTNVIPSPRMSDRVPFGTGRAMLEANEGKTDLTLTYCFDVFKILKDWIDLIEDGVYQYNSFPLLIKKFIDESSWNESLIQLKNNTNSNKSFLKRFYAKYDAFWVLKFVHFSRDNFYPDSSLLVNVNSYLFTIEEVSFKNITQQLVYLRSIDKGQKKRDS
ncbi:MAG: hypothetical protein P8L23_04040 [Flavobacteriales bacterium]|nr:hypothetical protein [Flavobacteriales bacterium]